MPSNDSAAFSLRAGNLLSGPLPFGGAPMVIGRADRVYAPASTPPPPPAIATDARACRAGLTGMTGLAGVVGLADEGIIEIGRFERACFVSVGVSFAGDGDSLGLGDALEGDIGIALEGEIALALAGEIVATFSDKLRPMAGEIVDALTPAGNAGIGGIAVLDAVNVDRSGEGRLSEGDGCLAGADPVE